MFASIGLYILFLSCLTLGTFLPGFAWLAPFSMLLLFLGVLWLRRKDEGGLRALGFPADARWGRRLAAGAAAGLLIVLIFFLIFLAVNLLKQHSSGTTADISIKTMITAILVPGLIVTVEEMVYRGYFYQELNRRYGCGVAVVGSAALWAFSHLPLLVHDAVPAIGLLLGWLTFFAWGCTLSLIYIKDGASLWTAVGVHYGYNLGFSILGAIVGVQLVGGSYLAGFSPWVPETGILGLLMWAALALLASWRVSR